MYTYAHADRYSDAQLYICRSAQIGICRYCDMTMQYPHARRGRHPFAKRAAPLPTLPTPRGFYAGTRIAAWKAWKAGTGVSVRRLASESTPVEIRKRACARGRGSGKPWFSRKPCQRTPSLRRAFGPNGLAGPGFPWVPDKKRIADAEEAVWQVPGFPWVPDFSHAKLAEFFGLAGAGFPMGA